jgi:AraC family transcriptional regulator
MLISFAQSISMIISWIGNSDFRDSANPMAAGTAGKVLWSSGAAWRGVVAEAYHFDHLRAFDFLPLNDVLLLHLSSPAPIKLEAGGRSDTRLRMPGDISIIPAKTTCRMRSRVSHEVLVVTVSQEVMVRAGFELRQVASSFQPMLRTHVRDDQLEYICRALQAEAQCNYASGALYGDSLASALGVHLITHYSASNSAISHTGGMAPQALRRVIEHIESNLESPLPMSSLAEIAGLSQYRFAHNFRSATGMPPHQFVLHKRLARAKQMLRETRLSVLEIAYAVGCQSSSQFNALFKRDTGTIPSVYRASFQ